MKNILSSVVAIFATLLAITTNAQIDYPCDHQGGVVNGYTVALQSSTSFTSVPSLAIDGSISTNSTARTTSEQNAWLELDLGAAYNLERIELYYPTGEAMNNYYILLSEEPFSSKNLSQELSSSGVHYYHIQNQIPSGQQIPVSIQENTRYVRIQLGSTGTVVVSELIIIGGGGNEEICNNGIDDDCDGKIDCEDSDCAAIIINNCISSHPTCNICYDGSIYIQASGPDENIAFSIDGGVTFFTNHPTFDNLLPGEYKIVIKKLSSGCTSEKTVYLTAPPGFDNDCCENGGFELGDFTGWTGGIGTYEDPIGSNTDIVTTGDFPRHSIHSVGYTDPIIPELPIFSPGTGTYIAQLGNSNNGKEKERLTYCFDVQPCNQNFRFNFLIILEDPADHNDNEKPFFAWRLFNESTDETIANEKFTADVNDEVFNRFDRPNGTKIAYTPWRCENIDLSDIESGTRLCIVFTTADCKKKQHFGYAYIDGLCNSLEDNNPVAVLDIPAAFCKNQEVLVDATNSSGYVSYNWRVCELSSSGEEINCVSLPDNTEEFITEQITAPFNITELYINGGEDFDCGKTYRIKLKLDNECTEPVTFDRDFIFKCVDGPVLNYKDIINCSDETTDILIEGDVSCSNCNFEWTPSQYLDNPHIAFPEILGTINANALDYDYTVFAIDENGCTDQKTVMIFNAQNLDVKAEVGVSVDFCNFQLFATLTSTEEIPIELITVTFENTTTSETFLGTLISNNSSHTELKYILYNIFISRVTSTLDNWIVRVSFLDSDEVLSAGECQLEDEFIIEPDGLFYGPTQFVMPNVFSPNGDGVNDLFRPYVPDNAKGVNAYWGRLRVWNRWGQKVFDKELTSSDGLTPIDANSLAWDGTQNGEPALPDVYIYKIEFKNCNNPNGEENNCEGPWCLGSYDETVGWYPSEGECDDEFDCLNFECNDGPCPRCIGCEWEGDVEVVY